MQLPLLRRLSGAFVIVLAVLTASAPAIAAEPVGPVTSVESTTIFIDGGGRNGKVYEYGDVHVFKASVFLGTSTAGAGLGGTVTWTDTVGTAVSDLGTTAVKGSIENVATLNFVPTVGLHTLKARFNGDGMLASSASETTAVFNVVKNGTSGTVTGDVTGHFGKFTIDSNVATDVDGTQDASVLKYTGTVVVSFNNATLKTFDASLYPANATFDWTFQPGVSYKFNLRYTGDANNLPFNIDQTVKFDALTPPTPAAQPVPSVDKTATIGTRLMLSANDYDKTVAYPTAPAGYVNIKDQSGTQVARFLINTFSWTTPFTFTKTGRQCLTAQWEGDIHYTTQAANDLGCWVVSAAVPPVTTPPSIGTSQSTGTVGYRLLAADGGIFTFGKASFLGSGGNDDQTFPVVASAAKKDGNGYWMVRSNGAVFAYGSAVNYGDRAGYDGAPIVAMASTASGNGYWLISSAGEVFTFGDAAYYGSTGGNALNAPIIAVASTSSGRGYWLIAKDGGIFSFGDARFYGSMGDQKLNAPVITMASTASGNGYWLVAADGGIFSFGDAAFYGSTGDLKLNAPVIAMSSTASGRGYWLVGADGGIFCFGDAPFLGSTGDSKLNKPIIGISPA